MKRRIFGWSMGLRLSWFITALVVPLAGGTASGQSPGGDIAGLRRLLTDLPQKQVVCSAKIVDLTTGEVVLELNANLKLVPASNQKLWVLAAAAVDLGEAFDFRTILAVKDGDIHVIGEGDPGFGDARLVEARGDSVTGELERWAAVLAAKGFDNLTGRLVYDDTLFDRQWTHPSWDPRDLQKWYAAPVGALIVNDNCIDVTLYPAKHAGEPARWSMVPSNDAVKIVNRCVSGGKGRAVINRPGSDMRFVVSGRCHKQWKFPAVAVTDPVALFAGSFRHALGEHGIATDSEVRTHRVRLPNGDLPPDLTILAEYRTPLPDVLRRIGKNSQNLFAEAVLKRLGFDWACRAGLAEPVGSWSTGRSAMLDFARRVHVPLAESDYHDGAGLSRDNQMSAAQAVELLSYMHRHPTRVLFMNSLAVAGCDGSLKKRMANIPGTVYAKTGYMSGIRTLSGYVVTPSGRWFAFSVLFNGIKGPTGPFNKVHDNLCRRLAAWPTES